MTITAPITPIVVPGDNSSQYDTGPGNVSITPSGFITGDLVFFACARRNTADIIMGNVGGQSWTAGTLRQAGTSASVKAFFCKFNGTWSNNPSIVTINSATALISLFMGGLRPSSPSNTWALDVLETYHNVNAPVTPFDVTATGPLTVAASVGVIALFYSLDNNTWQIRTAGWANMGNAQYRNVDSTAFRDQSLSIAYILPAGAGQVADVTNRQLTLGGDAGLWIVNAYKEQSSGVTVSAFGDAVLHNGEAGIVINGTSFGAAHTGSADVIVSPTNNIADGSAVVQTQTAWSDTAVTITSILGSFPYNTNLYGFVRNSAGQSNATGFIIQREAWLSIAAVFKNLAGTLQANLTNIRYRVNAGTINGTLLLSGSNGTTDASGNFAAGPYVLAGGGPLNPGDDVWFTAEIDGASQALSFATCVKITPTYT